MTSSSEFPRWVVSRKVRINKRLTVEMTVGSTGQLFCEWDPGVPARLTPPEMQRYRQTRDELVAEFMERAGVKGKAVVVEV